MKVLDRSWTNCLRMWKWISENLPDGFSEATNDMKYFVIENLKSQWLQENGFFKWLPNDCFFCAYDEKHGNGCASCPAGLVKKGFRCYDAPYHYAMKPIDFYQYINELDLERRK